MNPNLPFNMINPRDGFFLKTVNFEATFRSTENVRCVMTALRMARLLRGRGLVKVAHIAHVAPITLSKWELGEGVPSALAVMRISISLGLDGLGFINEHDVMEKARSSQDQATYGIDAIKRALVEQQKTHSISQRDVQALSESVFRKLGSSRGGLNAVQTADLVRGFDMPLSHLDMKARMLGLGGITLTKHKFQDIEYPTPLWCDLSQWIDPTGLRARSAHLGAQTPPHLTAGRDETETAPPTAETAQPDSDDDLEAILGGLDD
jgi:transcriptional regulator with XRE-family HTH domain